MPKISVIVPVYKTEQYLHRCVDSILAQSFTDFDLILVDDGSPDNCPKICDEYKEKDNRVHVIHQDNMGLSGARNSGIDYSFKNSNSEWITFIDSDDWISEFYLNTLFVAAVSSNVDLSVLGFKRVNSISDDKSVCCIDDECTVLSPDKAYRLFSVERFNISLIVAWGKLYNKKLFTEVRYPIGKIHEDQYVTYKLIFKSGKIAVSPYIGYFYYQSYDSIMNSRWSPKKLDAYGSFDEQLNTIKHEKAIWAYITSVFHLTIMSLFQLNQISKTEYKKTRYYFILIKKYIIFSLKFLPFSIPYAINSIRVRKNPIFKV